jgi:hypothetical protein
LIEIVPSSLGTTIPLPVADILMAFKVPLPVNEYRELLEVEHYCY